MVDFKALRESLSPEQIKNILRKYNTEPVHETFDNDNSYIQYPTVCHNLYDGSHKLYYYKNSHMFRCYTECAGAFDIFQLLIKMENLRGNDITIFEAIKIAGLEAENIELDDNAKLDAEALDYHDRIYNTQIIMPKKVKTLSEQVMKKYTFNPEYLTLWEQEGISLEAMRKFGIAYDVNLSAIVIPHKDINGNIVGVRGRFLSEGAKYKYMPLMYGDEILSHPIQETLYGLYENKANIERTGTAVLFEGEKSVLKFETYFPNNNISVAVGGSNLSQSHIKLLRQVGATNVVLAFDKQYKNTKERAIVQGKYEEIAKRLAVYFNTTIIFDFGMDLDYKDSPIDQGKEVFSELFKYRYYVDN